MVMDLFIEKTADCPQVDFKASGELSIEGRAIGEDPFSFWQPVLEWAEQYVLNAAPQTRLSLFLEYINSSSSKYVNEILRRFEDAAQQGIDIQVIWRYEEGDDSLYQLGEDFASIVSLPFTFSCETVEKNQPKRIKIQSKSSGKSFVISYKYWDAIRRNGHGEEYTVLEEIL